MQSMKLCYIRGGLHLVEYYEYKTVQGDTFDSISLDFYGSEKYVHEIMNMNPSHIRAVTFSHNTTLKIPLIDTTDTNNLPPWRS
jgi:phage tail protein X